MKPVLATASAAGASSAGIVRERRSGGIRSPFFERASLVTSNADCGTKGNWTASTVAIVAACLHWSSRSQRKELQVDTKSPHGSRPSSVTARKEQNTATGDTKRRCRQRSFCQVLLFSSRLSRYFFFFRVLLASLFETIVQFFGDYRCSWFPNRCEWLALLHPQMSKISFYFIMKWSNSPSDDIMTK